jgi:hypothetical protein
LWVPGVVKWRAAGNSRLLLQMERSNVPWVIPRLLDRPASPEAARRQWFGSA